MKQRIFRNFGSVVFAIAAASATSSLQAAPLEEIVVNAQKRVESLQDVPVSITTLDGTKIEQAGIANLEDLSAYVPNLLLTENAVATSIVLRGVGPGANQSFEQSVGFFVDGVHLPKGRQTRIGLFDLERVEVLRGPQGILFGKNTLAGAVNVTSATPQVGDEFGGKIALAVESNEGESIEGHVAGSVTDSLALRFAFKELSNDGYLDNGFNNDDGPTADETLWRFAATWEPNDNTRVKFKYAEADHRRVGGTAVITVFDPVENLSPASQLAFGVIGGFNPEIQQNVENGVLDPFRDALSLGGLALAQSLGRDLDRTQEKPEGTDTENRDGSLNIEFDFGDGYTFTSVTGYSEYEYEDGIDADFLPIQFIGRSDISEFDQFSQEFRIASDPSKRFSFIAGAYYTENTQAIDRIVAFDGTLGLDPAVLTGLIGAPTLLAVPPANLAGTPFTPLVNGLTSFNQIARRSFWEQDTEAWAVFFQGEYNITDRLKLTAGLRYTDEDKDANAETFITDDSVGLANLSLSPFVGPVIRGVAPTTYNHRFVDTRSTDQLIPGVTLEWDQSDENLFYISYSEGFKSGGFNSVDDQAPDLALQPVPGPDGFFTVPGQGWSYDDETAQSYAIGGKHILAGGSMTLNWELFTGEYDDQQVSTFVGIGFEVRNAATTDVEGLEVDWRWQATDNILVGASVALLDATYASFPEAGCTAVQASAIAGGATSFDGCTVSIITGVPIANQDLAGGTLTHSPEYSGSLFFDYDAPVTDNWNLFFGVDVNFTDDFLLTGDLDPLDNQESFEKINARIGVRSDNWEIMAFGRNITDEEVATGGFDVPLLSGAHAVYTDPDAIFGVRVAYSF